MDLPCQIDPTCGVDSVATCPRCQRRACNRHYVVAVDADVESLDAMRFVGAGRAFGAVRLVHPVGESYASIPGGPYRVAYSAPPSRCTACREADGAMEAAFHAPSRVAPARPDDLPTALRRVNTLRGLRELLAAHATADVPPAAARAAWVHVADGPGARPDAHVAEVHGTRRSFGRERWTATRYEVAWSVPEDAAAGALWLDATGSCWAARYHDGSGALLLDACSDETVEHVVLPYPALVTSFRRRGRDAIALDGVTVRRIDDDAVVVPAVRAVVRETPVSY